MPIEITITRFIHDGHPAAAITGFPENADPPPLFGATYVATGYSWSTSGKEHAIYAGTEEDLEKALEEFQRRAARINPRDTQRARIRQRLLEDRLLGQLPEKVVSIEYDGYGDSGDISGRSFEDKSAPEDDEYGDFLWEMVCEQHPSFYDDDGGTGTVTWDLVKDEITVEHGEHYTETRYTTTVIPAEGPVRHEEVERE